MKRKTLLASRAYKRVGSVVGEEPRAGARAAMTDRGMCVPLPFHVTSGQPAMGQGVAVYVRERHMPLKWQGLEHIEGG
ncbi:unnamed protein product [Spirodela intermedia]|uniref:Uncharacterized protein n=1 Tax=Spirodela intermedia TaxID=51605 RepID=A0A7I8IPS3_SPIIN|nr:unnamed protein product [Spirodela intermedia]CAA6659949.1 unnamed protein product [Spirodela intermedia]